MRLIIGILLGILIVFNWSKIKDLFDSSLSQQSQKNEAPAAAPTAPVAAPVQNALPSSISGAVEQHLKEAADRK